MSATVYRDTNYGGVFAHLRPGFYSGRDLVGYHHQSTYGEELNNEISSIRVDQNTIAVLYRSSSMSASQGARVVTGPAEIPDLGTIGMDDEISAILILGYKPYDSGISRGGGATIYSQYDGQGKRSFLRGGNYSQARLASEEVKFTDNSVRSISVDANVVALLFDGPNFDAGSDAVAVVGPTTVRDLDNVGMIDRVSSIRIIYTDPFDTPGRPSSSLGSTRWGIPGGSYGWGRGDSGGGAGDDWTDLVYGPHAPAPAPAPALAPAPASLPAPPGPVVVYLEKSPSEKQGNEAIRRSRMYILVLIFVLFIVVAAVLSTSMMKRSTRRTPVSAPLPVPPSSGVST